MSDDRPTSLVLLRDRREEVIQLLTDSFANDLLGLEGFEERVSRAHQATTIALLDELVGDLEPLPPDAERALLPKLETDASLTTGTSGRGRNLSAIFSHLQRRGNWAVPPVLKVRSVFGNAELDLRQARLAPGVTEINVTVVFGNLEILVPPSLAVECEGTAVFASFEDGGGSAVADPDRPLLRITGRAVFGNVQISTRPPGEKWRALSERKAAKRLRARREKRGDAALPAHETPVLPPHED